MGYKLFTLPSCEKCTEVKKYLKGERINYEEINAAIGEGKIEFREFYNKNRKDIQRESDGAISLPILVYDEKIFQGLEEIINNKF